MEKLTWPDDQSYRVLIDHLQDGIFVIENERFVFVNQRLADILGHPAEELIGKIFVDFIADEDRAIVLERHRARLAGEKVPEIYDLHIITGQGTTVCCSLNAGLSRNQAGHVVAVGSLRDVTRERAAQEELKSIFDHLPDVFYRVDMQGIITQASPSVFELLGYRPEEIIGTPMAFHYANPEERQKLAQVIAEGGGKVTLVEGALKRKDGSIIWVSTRASVRYDADGEPFCIEGVTRDISERKRMEDMLVTMSRTDVLTGTWNRGFFMEKSEEVVRMVRRYQHSATIMMADLDHFKSINDRYGHYAGDLVLEMFANICRDEIRESDILGRLGGEEFALMLPETSIAQATTLAERVRKATAAARVRLDGQEISVTVSIGLAQVGTGEQALETAIRRADHAMYRAKQNGRDQVAVAPEVD